MKHALFYIVFQSPLVAIACLFLSSLIVVASLEMDPNKQDARIAVTESFDSGSCDARVADGKVQIYCKKGERE